MLKKILMVDDSKAAQFFLKGCIPKDKDFEVFIAGDGKEGFEMFREIRPDLTFLDLTMPVMDGVEVLTEIKKIAPEAIVVVLTANIQRKVVEQVKALGAFQVLRKPPKKEMIRSVLFGAEKELEKRQ